MNTGAKCPTCDSPLTWWSDSSFGSYGQACESCKLFWMWESGASGPPTSIPLDHAHFPSRLRSIPHYRNLVGWTGPTS